MKKTMTFIVLAVFASAILVGCGQTEGDPNASTPAATDSSAGTMNSKPGQSGLADSSTTPGTGATSDSSPATGDSAAAPETTTSGGN